MAITKTREQRAHCWRNTRALTAAAVAAALFSLCSAPVAMAQATAPAKQQLRVNRKAPPKSPADSQADQLNEKWLTEFNKAAPAPEAKPETTKPDTTKAAVAAKPAPAAEPDDERVSSVPSAATLPGASARTVVAGSIKLVKADSATAAFNSMPGGANQPILKDLNQAFAGFAPAAAKVEVAQGRTADGSSRLLYASIGEGKGKQAYWWFSPSDQPEGWFDDSGKRLGGTALTEPKPDSRISSPFGTRRYYGRSTGTGFHNGIDFEGKVGEPIYAAADGVINHQGWYYNYGRTVKISHADNFETLYAHMSRFATGVGPGSRVHKGDLIGYVGSTGRSTGPHLHFSAIVDGQFVDPAPYISQGGGHGTLGGEALVAFRKWQQDVRTVMAKQKTQSEHQNLRYLQGADAWNRNPFAAGNPDRF